MTRKMLFRGAALFLCALLLFPLFAKAAPVFAAERIGGGGNRSFSTTREDLLSLGLPVVEIDTADGDYVTSRLQYKDATMRISLTRDYAAFQNTYTDEDGGAVTIIRPRAGEKLDLSRQFRGPDVPLQQDRL